MRLRRVAIVGAGMGGLAAALELAAQGVEVLVLERAATPGGKMREVAVGEARIDAGPTVLTMRWVLEELFAASGASLADHLTLRPAGTLARHAWSDRERLDLFADPARSIDAIGAFAGPAEARAYRDFTARARNVYRTLEDSFIRSPRPSPLGLTRRAGLRGLGDLWRISPFTTLSRALGQHFRDPRLRQLFGRYATYCGSSPFLAPATLMLVAHVEQEGVWLVEGGMHRIASALAALATARGAAIRYGTDVAEVVVRNGRVSGVRLATDEQFEADAVIVNADVAAVANGNLGAAIAPGVPATPRGSRSLSAVTWNLVARARGFPLLRHTVFFSRDYAAEFDDILQRDRTPAEPTVYLCAQDRDDRDGATLRGPERLLCLVNAPASGDVRAFDGAEIARCEARTFALLQRCGLHVEPSDDRVVTTPADFERLFPATGGALYGRASHGWTASFQRPGARTRMPGLYLAGGSVHPGPGVPMAALSGRLAAKALLEDAGAP
jgi:1-hydroxycarotenoid 3,4-desaturase